MARTAPTSPTPAPTPAIQRGDRATFSNRVDDTITYLTGAPAEIYGLATNAYNNALDAFGSATTANTAKNDAQTARDTTLGYRDTTMGYRDTTLGYRDAAAASAAAAASSATALTATSTSSNTLGTGAKTFTVQAGKQFAVGVRVVAVNPSDATQSMSGPVTSYSGTTLSLGVDEFNGTGTVANWNLSVAGMRGATGATGNLSGGNLTGALNEKTATDIASAASPDIWSPAGNYFGMTGTATITGFPAAPQAGAFRTFIARGAFAMTASANLDIKGGSFTASAGDEIDVRAETTTLFRVTRRRADGTSSAVIPPYQNAMMLDTTGVFIPTVTGWHEITLFGAGGSGASAVVAVGNTKVATGGGAGGVCRATRWLVAGQSYVFNAGSGVAVRGTNPGSVNGSDGGATTFSGTGIATMTANGGKGGKFAVNGPAVGGDGGTATGGDFNYTGGRGGNVTGTSTGRVATGGGAVGLFGVARNGGDIVQTAADAASGGASPGGDAGSINSAAGPTASGGGGMGGAAAAVTTATNGNPGKAAVIGAPNLLLANSGGTNGSTVGTSSAGSAGGGTGGSAASSGSVGAGIAGFFGGSGGTVVTDTGSIVSAVTASGGDFGGGSGGIVYYTGSSVSHGGATLGGKALIRFN